MTRLHLLLLVVISGIAALCKGQTTDQLYECYAYGDPHVVTWHPKTGSYNHYHACYENGFFELVRNEFLYYKVKVSALFSIDVEIYFYNGINRIPICLIVAYDFQFELDDQDKCASHGITWSLVTSASEKLLTISYGKASFSTNIRQMLKSGYNTRHYNLHVWLTKSISARSTGICQKDDKNCLKKPSRTGPELKPEEIWPQRRSITENQARSICKSHVDSFLTKTRRAPHQRSINMNDTIAIVMAGCVEDLVLTGVPEVARSSVDVLMIEELTADVTSIESIEAVIDAGVYAALDVFNEAVEEAEAHIPELLGLTTPVPPTTKPAATTTTTTTTTTSSTTRTTLGTTTAMSPLGSYKCVVFENMYVQTWHPADQVDAPSRACMGSTKNYELVRNPFVRFTLTLRGSVIDELTLILFSEAPVTAVCTFVIKGSDVEWMDCSENGIQPSLGTTATHKMLTVNYPKANFTTTVSLDTGMQVGEFHISIWLSQVLSTQSTGICSLRSPCRSVQQTRSKKRRSINILGS